ncbi:MAG TPA: hypothetical protein VH375_11085 [Rhodanobacteraceae bacterium]|jgi:hypothetical protein
MDDPLRLARYPLLVFMFSFLLLWLLAWIAASRFKNLRLRMQEEHAEYNVVQGATLTLLGLIIGFTFSMALNRYDQRKNLEEEEANAIGTEYLRVDFLPAAEAAKAKELLVGYLDQRVLFYTTRDEQDLQKIDDRTAKLQAELWSVVQKAASAEPTPPMAVTVIGMNDVLNSQGYTLAAWRNRIPVAAWWLMLAIAMCATVLVGVGVRKAESNSHLLFILPLIVSIAFFLIADIDSPRRGMIRVVPQNLLTLSQSLQAH